METQIQEKENKMMIKRCKKTLYCALKVNIQRIKDVDKMKENDILVVQFVFPFVGITI